MNILNKIIYNAKNQKSDTFLKSLLTLSLDGTPSPTRTDMNRSSTDFESVASTNSAIGALKKFKYIIFKNKKNQMNIYDFNLLYWIRLICKI